MYKQGNQREEKCAEKYCGQISAEELVYVNTHVDI